jgi:uncharacterized membrane protein (DUF485 family)
MDHSHPSPPPREVEDSHVVSRNSRTGLTLFSIYLILYAGYVLTNTFNPKLMDVLPWAGVNLAVIYGLGLIATAFLLAVIYVWLCRSGQEKKP